MSETQDVLQQKIAKYLVRLQAEDDDDFKQDLEEKIAELRQQLFHRGVRQQAMRWLVGGGAVLTVGALAAGGIAPLLTAGLTAPAIAQLLAGFGGNVLSGWVAEWAEKHGNRLLADDQEQVAQTLAVDLQAAMATNTALTEELDRLLAQTNAVQDAVAGIAAEQEWQSDTLLAQLRLLETMWQGLQGLPDAQRRATEQTMTALAEQRAALVAGQAVLSGEHREILDAVTALETFTVSNVSGMGIAVGHGAQANVINLGTILYGRTPNDDEQRRLRTYLEAVAGTYTHLPLRGLDDALGKKGVPLSAVYTLLATRSSVEKQRSLNKQDLQDYFERNNVLGQLRPEFHPEFVLPSQAIKSAAFEASQDTATGRPISQGYVVYRALLATEAVCQHQRCVLLGDPGSGKSTFVRHLAWILSLHSLGQVQDATHLAGWDAERSVLPIVVPLRTLAGQLCGVSEQAYTTTMAAVLDAEMARCDYDLAAATALRRDALRQRQGTSALLLFDGLDEVPMDGTDAVASRQVVLDAVSSFARLYPDALLLITCRTRAFTPELRDGLGWPVEELAPFTMGQIRHFVPAWYGELVKTGSRSLTQEQADALSAELLDALRGDDKRSKNLREMAKTPLLLTLMSLVLYNAGTLPRERPQLYESVLNLLLGHWDKVRDGQTLGEAIGRPDWTSKYILPVFARLSYEAHAQAVSEDGRGRLARLVIRDRLEQYFQDAGQMRAADAASAAQRCLDYIDERSGLLAPDGSDTYMFAHLTLQEHCAGRHMAKQKNPVAFVMEHRGDDRWREPILLGMGQDWLDPLYLDKLFQRLAARDEGEQAKRNARWYRDLILAAELGADRDWAYLRTTELVEVSLHQEALRTGLVELLTDPAQPLPIGERLRAGTLLGDLGDPRVPVTPAQWQQACQQRSDVFGQPSGYWCFVPGGTYRIGGWDEDEESAYIALPAYWVARYPITVAQYAAFLDADGYEMERYWTPNGWKWKQEWGRTQPWGWGESTYAGHNQAVTSIEWYEASVFARWLHEQLVGVVPAGYEVRLPTEAEWEVAAASDGAGNRRTYPWGEEPDTERAICKETGLNAPAPVGCCPLGAAASGALDMGGNVWEPTMSHWTTYPQRSGEDVRDFQQGDFSDMINWDVSWRGGSYRSNSMNVRCSERHGFEPYSAFSRDERGLRVCLVSRWPVY